MKVNRTELRETDMNLSRSSIHSRANYTIRNSMWSQNASKPWSFIAIHSVLDIHVVMKTLINLPSVESTSNQCMEAAKLFGWSFWKGTAGLLHKKGFLSFQRR